MIHGRDARVVDEMLERAVSRADRGEELQHGFLVGDVGDEVGVTVDGEARFTAAASDDVMTLPVVLREKTVDTAAGSGD